MGNRCKRAICGLIMISARFEFEYRVRFSPHKALIPYAFMYVYRYVCACDVFVCINVHVCAQSCERQSKEIKRLGALIPCKPIHTHQLAAADVVNPWTAISTISTPYSRWCCRVYHIRAHMLHVWRRRVCAEKNHIHISPLPSVPMHSMLKYATVITTGRRRTCKRWLAALWIFASSGWSHKLAISLTHTGRSSHCMGAWQVCHTDCYWSKGDSNTEEIVYNINICMLLQHNI